MEILELFVICILDPIQELSTDTRWGVSATHGELWGPASLGPLHFVVVVERLQYTPEACLMHQLWKVLRKLQEKVV